MDLEGKIIMSKKDIDSGALDKILKNDFDYIIFEKGVEFGYIISITGCSIKGKAIVDNLNNRTEYFKDIFTKISKQGNDATLTIYIPNSIMIDMSKKQLHPEEIFGRDVIDKIHRYCHVSIDPNKIKVRPAAYTGVSEVFTIKIQEILDKWLIENK